MSSFVKRILCKNIRKDQKMNLFFQVSRIVFVVDSPSTHISVSKMQQWNVKIWVVSRQTLLFQSSIVQIESIVVVAQNMKEMGEITSYLYISYKSHRIYCWSRRKRMPMAHYSQSVWYDGKKCCWMHIAQCTKCALHIHKKRFYSSIFEKFMRFKKKIYFLQFSV